MKNSKIFKIISLGIGVMTFASCTDLVVEEKDSVAIVSSGAGFVAGTPGEQINALYNGLGLFQDLSHISK